MYKAASSGLCGTRRINTLNEFQYTVILAGYGRVFGIDLSFLLEVALDCNVEWWRTGEET